MIYDIALAKEVPYFVLSKVEIYLPLVLWHSMPNIWKGALPVTYSVPINFEGFF